MVARSSLPSSNEVIFVVEEVAEGGYIARAIGTSIYTEVDSLADLHVQVRDAVHCHFEESDRPKIIRLHFVREEIIAA
ncbi:MAG: 2-oxoisovalerate dehydrogenase [Thioploca sp.]|nr:2-oxoisovalerate dehydrogenase [Thioploca sp.]